MPAPTLTIIGGPNGAGKTTFAREFLTKELKGTRFLNTDEIARGLSPFDVDSVAFKAARIFLAEVKSEISQGNNLAIESTLSGKTHAKIIHQARANGYKINLHFLWLPNPELSRQRVTQRKKQGGHDVPSKAIYRRFPRILTNLTKTYLPITHQWTLWDASHKPPFPLADNTNCAIQSVTKFFEQ